ncbi:MAG: hypothetical protein Tsb0032_29740 [Kiloniellaceae bacterium]
MQSDQVLIAVVLLTVSLAAVSFYAVSQRARHKQDGIFRSWPVPKVNPEEIDLRFATGPLGPGLETEIRFIAGYRVVGGITDYETWILCNLAKEAQNIFEFGTCTGKTTYLLACNAPAGAKITTLTLPPEETSTLEGGPADDQKAVAAAKQESCFAEFFYSRQPERAKIDQLFGDSKSFDESPYEGRCDLVFVDGAHAYSFVKSDSEKALRMVRPGGLVLWHDYHGPRRAKGVFRALNELARELPLRRIKGTSLVLYHRPEEPVEGDGAPGALVPLTTTVS